MCYGVSADAKCKVTALPGEFGPQRGMRAHAEKVGSRSCLGRELVSLCRRGARVGRSVSAFLASTQVFVGAHRGAKVRSGRCLVKVKSSSP